MANAALAKDIKGEYFKVDSRRLIFEEGYNRRENFGDIPGLAAMIKAAGIKNALWCYKKGENYVVKRGHRRTMALRILEKEGKVIMVPILLLPKGYGAEEAILDLIVENESLPFTPWEQAKTLRDLRNFGWSPKDMAERSGKTAVYVRRLLSLADAPQKLINLVREGRVTATFAMDMIAEERVDELLQKADENQLPVPNPELEMFPIENQDKPVKITRTDLQLNSWKTFKKWVPEVDENELAPEKAEFFNWLKKMLKGELTEKDFKKFFR